MPEPQSRCISKRLRRPDTARVGSRAGVKNAPVRSQSNRKNSPIKLGQVVISSNVRAT